MKLKSLIFVGLLALTSCTNQSQGFYIAKFYPLGPGCDGVKNQKDSIVGNGFLDVAAGSAEFFVGVDIGGAVNTKQEPEVIGTTTVEGANRNHPIINQQVVTYRLSKRVGGTPKPYITNITLPFNEAGEVFGPMQLISPELATQLFDGLTPPPGPAPNATIDDFVDVLADVEYKGEFSVSRTPFSTGVLTMPIRAYRSLPVTCTNGYVRFPNVPSLGGPDYCYYGGSAFLLSGQPFTTQLVQPVPPTCCSAVGAPGC